MKKLIQIRDLVNRFGQHTVHDGVNLEIYEGEVLGIVGGSGSGKSVLLHSILGLHTPTSGNIELFAPDIAAGADIAGGADDTIGYCQKRWGVLFQTGALFSGLTVLENVLTPIVEHTDLSKTLAEELACLKLVMVGLSERAFTKYPSELSGGMIKRVALARALAIEPRIVFLDEPTAGLDPISAAEFDELILYLREHLNLTVVMISHDLDSLVTICDRFAVIVDRKVIAGSKQEIMHHSHPWIAKYFGGVRGRAVLAGTDLMNNRTLQ